MTIIDRIKSSERSNSMVNKCYIHNCNMLLSFGFCYHDDYIQSMKKYRKMKLNEYKENIKILDFV